MTAECNNRCRASLDCPAFLIDYGLEVMMMMIKEVMMIMIVMMMIATKEYEFWTVMMVMTFTKDYDDSDDHLFCTVILVRHKGFSSRLVSASIPPLKMVGSCWCPVERKPTTLRRFASKHLPALFSCFCHLLLRAICLLWKHIDQVCLNAPACERAWIYERALGYMLEGHDDRVIGEVIKSISKSSLTQIFLR